MFWTEMLNGAVSFHHQLCVLLVGIQLVTLLGILTAVECPVEVSRILSDCEKTQVSIGR